MKLPQTSESTALSVATSLRKDGWSVVVHEDNTVEILGREEVATLTVHPRVLNHQEA